MRAGWLLPFGAAAAVTGLASSTYFYFQERRCERPPFDVVQKYPGFELRRYGRYLSARVPVAEASFSKGLEQGFWKLAGFIFGKNDQSTKIAMTAPVDYVQNSTVKFMMPSNSNSLPRPVDADIEMVEEPGGLYAVRTFSGFVRESDYQRQRDLLLAAVQRENLQPQGEVILGQYNSPYVLPFLRENEVRVAIALHGRANV